MKREQIERSASRNGIVSDVRNTAFECPDCDPQYSIKISDGRIDMENGLLPIMEIVPKSGNGSPSFVARWDQKEDTLDIDIRGICEEDRSDFKNGRNGCTGHHTKKLTDLDKHLFEVDIRFRGRPIFEGIVSFSKTLDFRPKDRTVFGDYLDAQQIRAAGDK